MDDFLHSMIGRIKESLERISGGLAGRTAENVVRTALAVCAVTLASFLFVDILYKGLMLYASFGPAALANRPAVAATSFVQKPSAESYAVIAERNLFETTQKALPDNSAAGYLPSEEYTAFDLKGTIAVDAATGYAIVEEKGKGKQKLYRVGEMMGQARLVRVTRHTAVLSSGGRELIMKVKESAENAPRGTSAQGPRGNIAISREDMSRSLGDLKGLMSQAVVRPNLVEGVQQGFVISNIVPGSLYQKLGLKNGDVVTDVNDKKLQGADDVLQLVNRMQTGESVSVSLLRNGLSETINYTFH